MGEEVMELYVSMLLNMVGGGGGGGGGGVAQSEAQHTTVTYPHYSTTQYTI